MANLSDSYRRREAEARSRRAPAAAAGAPPAKPAKGGSAPLGPGSGMRDDVFGLDGNV